MDSPANVLKPILLVANNLNDVELTLSALSRGNLGNEVIVVRDGAEALAYLQRTGSYESRPKGMPAVVLLDMKLPKVDGLEVLRTAKADPELKTVPIVMLTSSREEGDLINSYRLGVNAYVVKPVRFEDFVQAILELGVFRAATNQPPPGSVTAPARRH
jgi:CheY-like chemotaxis protein